MKIGDTTYLFGCLCGKTLCAEPDQYIDCCKERVDELLAEEHHQIEFRDDKWIIAHPMRERLNGTLFDCEIRWNGGDPGVQGRFELIVYDDGDMELGEKLDGPA